MNVGQCQQQICAEHTHLGRNRTNLSFNFFGTICFEDGVITIEYEFAEVFNLMMLPIFDTSVQFLEGRVPRLPVDCLVCSRKNRRCCFTPFIKIFDLLGTQISFLFEFLRTQSARRLLN